MMMFHTSKSRMGPAHWFNAHRIVYALTSEDLYHLRFNRILVRYFCCRKRLGRSRQSPSLLSSHLRENKKPEKKEKVASSRDFAPFRSPFGQKKTASVRRNRTTDPAISLISSIRPKQVIRSPESDDRFDNLFSWKPSFRGILQVSNLPIFSYKIYLSWFGSLEIVFPALVFTCKSKKKIQNSA